MEVCATENADYVNGIPSEGAQDNAAKLTKWLMEKYDIDIDHVIRHFDVSGKYCGEYWWNHNKEWNEFKKRIEKVKLSSGGDSSSSSSSSSSSYNSDDWIIISQSDSRWRTLTNGSGGQYIKDAGCGLCASSIVLEHYTGNKGTYLPDKLSAKASTVISANNDVGAIVTYFNDFWKDVGLRAEYVASTTMDFDKLDKVLKNGGCCIVDYGTTTYNGYRVWASGAGANAGHYVVIVAGNQKDGYYTRDSSSYHYGNNDGGWNHGAPEFIPYNEHQIPASLCKDTKYYYWITKK